MCSERHIKKIFPFFLAWQIVILWHCSLVQAKVATYHFYTPSLQNDTLGAQKGALKVASEPLSAMLGGGWSSDYDRPASQCLLGSMDYVGRSVGNLAMERVSSYEEASQQLQRRLFAAFSGLASGAGVAKDYLHLIKDTDQTETFIYRTLILLKNRRWILPQDRSPLNWLGQQYQNDPQAFVTHCGNKFVSQQKIGGALYVGIKLHFHHTEEKKRFDANMHFNLASLIKFNQNLETLCSYLHRRDTMSVVVLQVGGNPAKMGWILGAKEGSTQAPIANCDMEHLQSCRQILAQVLAYVGNHEKGNFSDQFDSDDSSSPVGPAVMQDILQSYESILPIQLTPSLVTPEIRQERLQLFEKYEDALMDQEAVQALLDRHFPLIPLYRQKLEQLEATAISNINLLQAAGRDCYSGDFQGCVAQGKIAEKGVMPVDLSDFQNIIESLRNISRTTMVKGYFFPYSPNQYVYTEEGNAYGPVVYKVESLTSDFIFLNNGDKEYVKVRSWDGGQTYRGILYGSTIRAAVTLVPNFLINMARY